jgi:hypothetical protein
MTPELPKLSRLIDASPRLHKSVVLFLRWVDEADEGFPDESLLDEAIETGRDAIAEINFGSNDPG